MDVVERRHDKDRPFRIYLGKSIFHVSREKAIALKNELIRLLDDQPEQKFNIQMSDQDAIEKLKDSWNTDYGSIEESDGWFALHTGGWSGNEQLIDDFSNTMFWMKSWEKTERGGHYYFKL